MQPGYIEKLKTIITSSPLLQADERTRWMELLPLMNDKQVFDLEAILKPQDAAVLPRASAPLKVPVNLPVDITEKELSKGTIVDGEHLIPAHTGSNGPSATAPMVTASRPPALKFSHLQAVPTIQTVASPSSPRTPVSAPAPAAIRPSTPSLSARNELKSLTDVAVISRHVLHEAGYQTLLKFLQGLVRKTNYFEVLFAFEKSPLFSDYVTTGQALLEDNSALDASSPSRNRPPDLLNRTDFESVTDLLRNIQIN